MSLYTEIQQAIEDVLKAHGVDTEETDALPKSFDELNSMGSSIQSEFAQVLERLSNDEQSYTAHANGHRS